MPTLKELIEYSKQNPETDTARKTQQQITAGYFDTQAQKEGLDLSWAGRPQGEAPVQQKRGLAGEIIPTAGSILGAIGGGIAGAPLGPAGAFAGGVAGATAGGAAGESIQQGIEKVAGSREEFDVKQIGETGVTSGAFQLIGGGVMKALSVGGQAAKPALLKLAGGLSGYSDDILKTALERGSGVKEGLKGGEKVLNDAVKKSALKVQEMAQTALKEAKKNLNEYAKQYQFYYKGGKAEGGAPGINISSLHRDLSAKFNLAVQKGKIVFDRVDQPSNIVSGADRSTIQEGYNALLSVKDNLSPKHLSAVLEKLIVLSKKTPAGSPTGSETKVIIKSFIDKTLENLKERAPLLHDAITDNLEKRIHLAELKEIFGSGNLSPMDVSKNTVRFLQMYNAGKLPIREAIEGVKSEVGDIAGKAAGVTMKMGDQFSIRAKNLTKTGILEKVITALPKKAIQNYVETGQMVKEMPKVIKETAKVLGITAKAALQEIINFSQEKKSD